MFVVVGTGFIDHLSQCQGAEREDRAGQDSAQTAPRQMRSQMRSSTAL
eukprot:SAG31_NODE_6426_length_2025_cov_0.934579_1_plen_47_part_10